MATTFVEVNNKHYNSLSMGKVFTKDVVDETTQETITKYFFQYFGGQNIEIDQQTYQDIIDGKYDPQGGGGSSTTYNTFPQEWIPYTSIGSQYTIDDFCAIVDSTESAVVGMAYLGELTFASTPFAGNAEALVEIVDENNGHRTIHIILSSGTNYPYHWEYTYWTTGGNVRTSGWIGFQPTPIVVNNVSPTWVSDSTYANYGYKGTIAINGVTSSMRAEVTFGLNEATSGNYAPICETETDGVVIYGKVDTTITIPSIVVYGG